jgi:hypothetical protein
MPQVSQNSFIAYIPQLYEVSKSLAKNFTIILYQNEIGNQIEAYNVEKISVVLYNHEFKKKKTLERINSQTNLANRRNNPNSKEDEIKLGTITDGTEGYISFSVDGNFTSQLDEDVLYAQVILKYPNSRIEFPRLTLAKTTKPGDLPAIEGRKDNLFTVPAPVYTIESDDYSKDPLRGNIIVDTYTPNNVTKIKFNNVDFRGYRNSYLENSLEHKFTQSGLNLNIAITDTFNTSKYSIYKVTDWDRKFGIGVNKDDLIELYVEYQSQSTKEKVGYDFKQDDKIGILLDSYNTNGIFSVSKVEDNNTQLDSIQTIKFIQGANVIDGNNGIAQIEINDRLKNDITSNVKVGAIESGDVINAGSTLEHVTKKLIQKTYEPIINPEYAPDISLFFNNIPNPANGIPVYKANDTKDIEIQIQLERGKIQNHWNNTDQGYYAGSINNVEVEHDVNVYTLGFSNPDTINNYSQSNFVIKPGINKWKFLITLDSNNDFVDSDGNIIPNTGYSGGTIEKEIKIEGTYPLYKGNSGGGDSQISTLYSLDIDEFTISQDFHENSATNVRHKILIPHKMMQYSDVNILQYNTLTRDYLDVTQAFIKKSNIEKTINGNKVQYTKFTKNDEDCGGDINGIPLYKVKIN